MNSEKSSTLADAGPRFSAFLIAEYTNIDGVIVPKMTFIKNPSGCAIGEYKKQLN
jgi:hypothetical protein